MKLLIIASATECGGAEAYLLTIAQAATQTGWETHAAFPLADITASLRQDLAAHQVLYHPLDIAEPRSRGIRAMRDAFLQFKRTRSVLLTVQPDVVLINLPWPDHCLGSILACGQLHQPTAIMFHLMPPDNMPLSRSRRYLYTWARARGQQWLTNSEANRHLLARLFQMPDSDLHIIYNGIKRPPPTAGSLVNRMALRQQVRQQFGFPATSKLLLTVGRLTTQKGYTDLLPAIPKLLEADPDIRFVWAGDGDQRQALRDRLADMGLDHAVLMLGYRSDVPQLLQAADLFVFPTRFEGHPFALLEAMAYGLPIVTTKASSIPELIEHQIHGLLCQTGDSNALFHAIHWALEHPEQMQQMAQKAQHQTQTFSQERMLKQTLSMLQALALSTPQAKSDPMPERSHQATAISEERAKTMLK